MLPADCDSESDPCSFASGIDAKAVTLTQYNILHLSSDGNLEIAWFLLEQGDKFGLNLRELANMRNNTGDKPLDVAKRTQELLEDTEFYLDYVIFTQELQEYTD